MRNIARIVILISAVITFQSCLTTHYWTAPKQINEELVDFKVYWNYFCNEENVSEKLDKKIYELLNSSPKYNEYIVLYQSNNSLRTGKRWYLIRFFKSEVEKKSFLNNTETKNKEFIKVTGEERFIKSWNNLNAGMSFIKVIESLPELNNFYMKQDNEHESNMIYKFKNVELLFDKDGKLIDWKK